MIHVCNGNLNYKVTVGLHLEEIMVIALVAHISMQSFKRCDDKNYVINVADGDSDMVRAGSEEQYQGFMNILHFMHSCNICRERA